MAVIVVTRLRLKDPGVLNDFFTGAAASLEPHQSVLTRDYPPPVVPAQ